MTQDHTILLLWNQTWQIALLWLFVAIAIRSIASNRPHLGHVLCVLVLLKFLIPPVCSSPISPFSWLSSASQKFSIPFFSEPFDPRKSSALNTVSEESAAAWSVTVSNRQISNEAFESVHSNIQSTSWMLGVLSFPNLSKVLFWGWLISVSTISFWLWGRYFGFLLRINSLQNCTSDRVTRIVKELAEELKLDRKIRVRILEEPIGPAVVGLLFPTILLPTLIVDRLSDSQLRSLIAHEMIHVRRCDLVWSLLQMLVTCLWWFHPVTWLLNRRLSEWSERCCDEETIASLNCPPSTYARCLLSVLEQKHQLQIASALPGVRPMQVTTNRLERIMRIEYGCHQRSPKWIWAVLFTLGVILVPGARFGIGNQPPAVAVPNQDGPATLRNEKRSTPTKDEIPLITETYSVDDLLARIVVDGVATPAEANQVLLRHLQVYKQPRQQNNKTDGKLYAQPVPAVKPPEPAALPELDGEFKLANGKLSVKSGSAVQRSVEERIGNYRKNGFKTFGIQLQLIESTQELAVNGANWVEANGTESAQLNEEQVASILAQVKSNNEARRVMAPSLWAPNGQQVNCCTFMQKGIEITLPDKTTKFAEVETGTWLNVTPVLTADGRVELNLDTKIVSANPTDEAPAGTITKEFKAECVSQLGMTVALRSRISDANSPKQEKSFLTLVKCWEQSHFNSSPDKVSKRSGSIGGYTLDQGDILGVTVEGVLPSRSQDLSKELATDERSTADSGYPISVLDDGKISLPLISPIPVRGQTIEQVQKSIVRAFAKRRSSRQSKLRFL